MKIVVPGGTGVTGQMLRAHWVSQGHAVVVLTRSPRSEGEVAWDGKNLGDWAKEIDGADAVVNLAGRTVNCRYTQENLQSMMDSRVDSTRVVGKAVSLADRPPRVWLNASTATIYAHTFGPAHDESGVLGGSEPDVPRYWDISIEIAKKWEEALFSADTPGTRRVALRSAMTMSTVPGSVFTVFVRLARLGLLGRMGTGKQFVSWIHERDFARAVDFLIEREDMAGSVNLAAPNPLPMDEFTRAIREELGVKIALPASEWMLRVGTWLVGSDRELVLKSRRVVSARLPKAGFEFEFEHWRDAVRDLVSRTK